MCAIMPMFLNLFKSCLAMIVSCQSSVVGSPATDYWPRTADQLPFVMRKCLVRIRHAVRVFFLLHCVAAIVGGVENLGCEAIGHRLFTATSRIRDNPTN